MCGAGKNTWAPGEGWTQSLIHNGLTGVLQPSGFFTFHYSLCFLYPFLHLFLVLYLQVSQLFKESICLSSCLSVYLCLFVCLSDCLILSLYLFIRYSFSFSVSSLFLYRSFPSPVPPCHLHSIVSLWLPALAWHLLASCIIKLLFTYENNASECEIIFNP